MSISDEQKLEMIKKLETEGLPAPMQKALIALFNHEAELSEALVAENERLIQSQQNQMRDVEHEQVELAQGVLDEHNTTVSGLISQCHEDCAAEERNCGRAIEGFKRKKDDDQADAIRNSLKQDE